MALGRKSLIQGTESCEHRAMPRTVFVRKADGKQIDAANPLEVQKLEVMATCKAFRRGRIDTPVWTTP
jgi:hypothetical protein